MIKLKSLLLEDPDSITIGDKYYTWESDATTAVFLIYKDIKTNKKEFFGYSTIIDKLFSSDPELLNEINTLKSKPKKELNPYQIDLIDNIDLVLTDANERTHSDLCSILYDLNRFTHDSDAASVSGRIFEIKGTVYVNFWQNHKIITPYKNIIDKMIKIIGYNPKPIDYLSKQILYQPFSSSEKYLTYDELYGNNTTLTLTKSEIEEEIIKKEKEYQVIMSNLHVKAGILSNDEKNRLKNTAILLKTELNLLHTAKQQGKSNLKDVELQKAILNAIHTKPKSLNDLTANLEKQFGMSLAQIRHKYNDIPFLKTIKSTINEYRQSRKTFINQ